MQAFSSKVPGQKSVNKMAADIKKKPFLHQVIHSIMICMFYTQSIGFIVLFENFRQGGGSHYNILFVLNLE